MSRVDPQDDTIRRFIASHYRYDPARRERRHVIIAAFDNEAEFQTCLASVSAEIAERRERGEPVDAREHASGVVHEPGDLRRAANAHIIRRAIEHGVGGAASSRLAHLDPGSSCTFARSEGAPG